MTVMPQSIDVLVSRFREAAIQKGDFRMDPKEDHRLYDEMAEAFWALDQLGAAGREAFQLLLHDDAPAVRSWVAAQLLSEGEAGARFVLEQLRKDPGFLGFTAEMVLEEHRKGTLSPPFGARGA